MVSIACLRDARDEVYVEDDTRTTGDDYVRQALEMVTERIQRRTRYEFLPHIRTRTLDALGDHIDEELRVLVLGQPLLAITSLTDGEANSLTEGTDYEGLPVGQSPFWELRMLEDSSYVWTAYDQEWQDAISITGIWGYHREYSSAAWLDSGDTVGNNPLSDTGTSLTVADADGLDSKARMPRFSPGQLLQIESEFLSVEAVDTASNTVTVIRGMQGSTKAQHAQGKTVYVWEADALIQRACIRWAAFLFAMRGNFARAQFDGVATTSYPSDMPGEVRHILDSFPRLGKSRSDTGVMIAV